MNVSRVKDVKMIIGALDLLHTACENIDYYEACERCPIKSQCLEDTALLDVAEEVTLTQLDEFLGLSDDIADFMDETDMEAYYADQARKSEAEDNLIYMD